MRGHTKFPYFFSFVALFLMLCMLLQACGSSTGNSSNGKTVITVAFQQFGPPPYPEQQWWLKVQQQLDATHSNITLKLEPIVASENDYYTKLDLQMRSASTAPDLAREDSFLIASDATANYLAPLDSYLNSWPEYNQQWYPSMQQITTFNGHNYGVMDGTDVRMLYYNKDIFQKAGLPTNWQPTSWADVLSAAQTIKAKVPGVIPINAFSGVPMGEASSLQTFQMLLAGTPNALYDYKTGKWVASSKGFQDALNFVKQVYNPSNLLGPSSDTALSPNAYNTVVQQLMPQGKLGMDLDGSWVPSTWEPGGQVPWTQWQSTIGLAKMPTQYGGPPGFVSQSGGWSYSITALSQHKSEAFHVLQVAMSANLLATYDVADGQIAPRKDITTNPAYAAVPENTFFSSLLPYTHFRPAFADYPKISVQIAVAMQAVMQGKSVADAMAAYSQSVTNIAGASNVDTQ